MILHHCLKSQAILLTSPVAYNNPWFNPKKLPAAIDDIMAMLFDQSYDEFLIDDFCGYNNSIFDQNFWDAEEQKVCSLNKFRLISRISYLILRYFEDCTHKCYVTRYLVSAQLL